MSQVTRKQRQQELRAIEKKQEEIEATASIELTNELIFKEQKQRLRRQLNDVPVISIDTNDTIIKPNRLQTRTEIKKQKKIDNVLKEFAVLPEDAYLNEDTNLRILKNLSMHKKYDSLQLSPEQEERMQENKERFDAITSQLWFLIKELESKNVKEPTFGQVPSIASKEKEKARNERRFYDVEEIERQQLALEHAEKKAATHKHYSDHIEEKLEEFTVPDGELTVVLKDLDRLLQDEKTIVQNEWSNREGANGVPPQDTHELLNILQDLEHEKGDPFSVDLTATYRTPSNVQQTTKVNALSEEARLVEESYATAETSLAEDMVAKARAEEEAAKILADLQVTEDEASHVKAVAERKQRETAEIKTAAIQQQKALEAQIEAEQNETAAKNIVLPESVVTDSSDEHARTTTITEHHRVIDLPQPVIDINEIKAQETAELERQMQEAVAKRAAAAEAAQKAAQAKAEALAKEQQEQRTQTTVSTEKVVANSNSAANIKSEVELIDKMTEVSKKSRSQTGILVTAAIFLILAVILVIVFIFNYMNTGNFFG